MFPTRTLILTGIVIMIGLAAIVAAFVMAPGTDNGQLKRDAVRGIPVKSTDQGGKLTTELHALIDPQYLPPGTDRDALTARMAALGQYMMTEDSTGIVYVYIRYTPGADLSGILPLTWNITGKDEASGIVEAWVPVDSLASLASLGSVSSIRAVMPPEVNRA
ncbi:MAG: hypothetical protein LUQ69_04865 [Methanoregulaceae archaeon]|nr:hypothetical protein [Methanoregulaceae archaeon]